MATFPILHGARTKIGSEGSVSPGREIRIVISGYAVNWQRRFLKATYPKNPFFFRIQSLRFRSNLYCPCDCCYLLSEFSLLSLELKQEGNIPMSAFASRLPTPKVDREATLHGSEFRAWGERFALEI